MLFEEIFLEKAGLQKFQMFRVLTAFDAANLTITDLSNKMGLSYQQSYNIFQELTEDIAAITGKSRAASKKALTTAGALPVSVDDYRYRLLEDAVSFQFLDYLVQGNRPSVDRFCAERFISRSTLMRKTAQLRKFLTRYHLKLSLTTPGLTGDEKQIRLFLNAVYWLGCHGAKWPFTSVKLPVIRQQYEQLATAKSDPIGTIQDLMFWALCRIRMSRGFVIDDCTRFDELFDGYGPFRPIIYDKKQFSALPSPVLRAETAFFYFFQNKTIQFGPLTTNDEHLLDYLKGNDGETWQFLVGLSRHLSPYLTEPLQNNLRNNDQLSLNVLRLTFSYYLLDGDYVKQADFFAASRMTYQQQHLRALIAGYVDDLPQSPTYLPLKRYKDTFVEMLFYLFVPYLQDFQWDENVKVKPLLETDNILNRRILEFLDNISIVQRLPDQAPLDSADLLITSLDDFTAPASADFVQEHPDGVFNWYIDATDTDYYQLYQKLYDLYLAKLVPRSNQN